MRKPVIKIFRTAVFLDTKWTHVLIPLVVLTIYFASFSWFLSWLLPEYRTNVNAFFVNSAWKFSLLLAVGLYLFFSIVFKRKKENKLPFEDDVEQLHISDFFLILLPLTPVVQYILKNQDMLSPLGALYVLAVITIFSILFILVMPSLLSVIASAKVMMILGMAFTYTITNMALLSAEFGWYKVANLKIQAAFFCTTFLISWILYYVIGRKFLYVIITILFIANSTIQLKPNENTQIEFNYSDNKLVDLAGSKMPLSMPNIYLLIYDAYVVNETMLGYGIDNSAQEMYLEALSFKIYPHTYSVGGSTLSTMSRVLDASTEYDDNNKNKRRSVSGGGVIQNLLMNIGYETYGIFHSDYFFRGFGSSYDYSFPIPKESTFDHSNPELLWKSIFMGEFRFDVEFNRPLNEEFIEFKTRIFESASNKPRFIYMHCGIPLHSQNSGACLPNETELYRERLNKANEEMKRDVDMITQQDSSAIIVIAGDHGPYLTKNCMATGRHYNISEISRLDIQDRFGTFLAIKWPSEEYSNYDDITVLQDIFPVIFAYLFEDDKFLEAKVASTTLNDDVLSGASVKNGIIHGGINDGEPLFMDQR